MTEYWQKRFDQLMALAPYQLWSIYGKYFVVYGSVDPFVRKEKLAHSIIQAEKNRYRRKHLGQEVQYMPDEKIESVVDALLGVFESVKHQEVPKLAEGREKFPVWQGLMSGAYDKYPKEGSHGDFISDLDVLERDAVVLGNLNYQVGNGGFLQWVDNGYALNIKVTRRALQKVGTPAAQQVETMVARLAPFINLSADDRGFGSNYWKPGKEPSYEFKGENEAEDFCDDLDQQFYSINDQFCADVENYFASKVGAQNG